MLLSPDFVPCGRIWQTFKRIYLHRVNPYSFACIAVVVLANRRRAGGASLPQLTELPIEII